MLKRFIEFCRAEKIFDAHKIVVAVSGGADSLALADLIIRARQRFRLEICIAHYDHGLRKNSGEDADFVKNFAESAGVNFFSRRGDVKSFAAENKISIETAARLLRYDFLSDIRRSENFDAIATAHHADDFAETVLMRILRGSGLSGLAAIRFKNFSEDYGLLIRPLLRFKKSELENYCRERNLTPRIDETNFETDATRNKIRLELLPELKKFNPNIVETLCRLGEISGEEEDFTNLQVEKIYPSLVQKNSDTGEPELLQKNFLKLHPALQRAAAKKFVTETAGTNKDFAFKHFETVKNVLIHNLSGAELPHKLRINLRRGKLTVTSNFNQTSEKGLVKLKTKEDFIDRVLYTKEQIAERVKTLSAQISEDCKDIEKPLLAVGILNGAVMFYTDIVRNLSIPVHFDFMIASSYDANTHTSGKVNILKNLDNDPKGRDILLIEDIVDSGTTMNYLLDYFKDKGAASVRICTLLDKPSRRKVEVKIDYCGFEVPDEFIVGYGLDFAQHYRNLPYLGVLKRSVYAK